MTHTTHTHIHEADPPILQTSSPWDDYSRSKATELWSNHSATQIAEFLRGHGYDVTRNSVVGFLHRNNLTAKDKSEDHQKARSSARNPRQPHMTPETIALRCVEITPRHLTLLDLEPEDCRFPYGGDGQPTTFCAHPRKAGSSYCTPHFALTRGEGTPGERAAHKVSRRMEAVA